jgi:hypothetical protein
LLCHKIRLLRDLIRLSIELDVGWALPGTS